MTRFQRVLEILDEAVGGLGGSIGAHGAFWRGLTRDQFVAERPLGRDLVVVGDGAASNLVRALRGQAPFGRDLIPRPPGASIRRMPAGRPPVPPESIAFIEQWIDDGCPDDVPPPGKLTWRPTNAPPASSRTDDIWFIDPQRGWAVNSNGQILHTENAGATWSEQFHATVVVDPDTGTRDDVYLRCVGFASASRGWVGTLTADARLFGTVDGGVTWTLVPNLPELAPEAVCGLSVVDESVVYASGTNFPDVPARMMRTVDGGATWQAWEMSEHATLLVDTYFSDVDHGWVVGGKTTDPNPQNRDNVRAVVLRTEDGGTTWVNKVATLSDQLPLGEWGWKIQFLNDRLGYVALESFERGAILKTTDGGESWTRFDLNDPQRNINLEGVGFIDENTGWVGGWGRAFQPGTPASQAGLSSATTDGARNWQDANEIGRFINRFRFFGNPVTVGYASGRTVYRYSAEPVEAPPSIAPPDRLRFLDDNAPRASDVPLLLPVTVPDGAGHLAITIWDRFGRHVRRLVDEPRPAAGPRTVDWDVTNDSGQPLAEGSFILRVTVDDRSESQIVHVIR